MKRELQRIDIPGEYEARRRTWDVVRAAYAEREPVPWPRRHARELAFAAAAVAVVAAAVTPPGRSVVNSVRDAVGREKVVGVRNAQRELVVLPAPGRLLVQSRRGAWVVQHDGSRRLLGPYRYAAWSPHGKFVAGVLRRNTLVALEPNGRVHWEKPRPERLAYPRWSFDGFRIAYFAGSTLRVVNGDGTGDRLIGPADPGVAPAWRPATHALAYVARGSTKVVDADRRTPLPPQAGDEQRLRTAVRPGGGPAAQVEALFRRSAILVGSRQVFAGAGRFRSLAWSPNGQWLAVSWPDADQLVFVRVSGKPRLVAVSDVERQFGSAPSIAGWSR